MVWPQHRHPALDRESLLPTCLTYTAGKPLDQLISRALRPVLEDSPTLFMQMEREVEEEFRPRRLEALQDKVDKAAEALTCQTPNCPVCEKPMSYHDSRPVSWLVRFGRLRAWVARYRCKPCKQKRRPLLEELGVEPGSNPDA